MGPGGDFSALGVGMYLGYSFECLTASGGDLPVDPEQEIRGAGWRLRLSNQTFPIGRSRC